MSYLLPALTKNAQNDTRRVGFEIEFAGVELKAAAQIVGETFKGECQVLSEVECEVKSERYGTFKVELDWQFAKASAKDKRFQPLDDALGLGADDTIIQWIGKVAGLIVPIEIVCPPLAISQLDVLNGLTRSLQKAGALGTDQAFLYAFGVHINPELPNLKVTTIVHYLQSFMVAQDWLVKKHAVNLSRRISPYVDLFGSDYARIVLAYDENIGLTKLIDDYLTHNPTRNRALDLLPLFMHLDQDKIEKAINDPRIKSRPTFHYRLPNCQVERPDWFLSEAWNIWCVIEHLAQNSEKRNQLMGQWRDYDDNLFNILERSWHQELDKIHQNLLSA